jgi:hypothetical protein
METMTMSYTNGLNPSATRVDSLPRTGTSATDHTMSRPRAVTYDLEWHLEPEELTVRLDEADVLRDDPFPSEERDPVPSRRVTEVRRPSIHTSTHVRETRPESMAVSARSVAPKPSRDLDANSWGALLRGPPSLILIGIVLGFVLFTVTVARLLPVGGTPAQARRAAEPAPASTVILPAKVIAMSMATPEVPAEPGAEAVPPPITKFEDVGKLRVKGHRKGTRRYASVADCDPPFRVDADGIKRIKLRCIQ